MSTPDPLLQRFLEDRERMKTEGVLWEACDPYRWVSKDLFPERHITKEERDERP